jgi:hypothetical protein
LTRSSARTAIRSSFRLPRVLLYPPQPSPNRAIILGVCRQAVVGGLVFRQLPPALVAQWIEQRFPKPRAEVRFLPGALTKTPGRRPNLCWVSQSIRVTKPALVPYWSRGGHQLVHDLMLKCVRHGGGTIGSSTASWPGSPSQGGDTGSNPLGTTQVSEYIDCDKRLVISQISATTARRALGGS